MFNVLAVDRTFSFSNDFISHQILFTHNVCVCACKTKLLMGVDRQGHLQICYYFFFYWKEVLYTAAVQPPKKKKKKRIQKKKIENRQNNNRKKIVLSWHHLFRMRHKVQSIQRYGILNTLFFFSAHLIGEWVLYVATSVSLADTHIHNIDIAMPLIYTTRVFFVLFVVICKIYLRFISAFFLAMYASSKCVCAPAHSTHPSNDDTRFIPCAHNQINGISTSFTRCMFPI